MIDINSITNNIENIKIDKVFNIEKFLKLNIEKQIAYIYNVIYAKQNKKLYLNQLKGAIALYENKAINMGTGEGKSLTSLIPLILKSLQGNLPSFYLSINDMLLKRDLEEFENIYSYFNIKTYLHFNEIDLNKKNIVIYTTANNLISNYLAKYIFLNKDIDRLMDINKSYCLIDEADMILIDNAIYPVVLNIQQSSNINYIQDIYNYALTLNKSDYEITENKYSLNENKYDEIQEKFKEYDFNTIIYTLEMCLNVLHNYVKNVDYIVENKKLFHINPKTGLKESLNTKDYTKQFILLKENLEIEKNENVIVQKMSIQSFFKNWKNKSAMSGTTLHEKRYFEFYGFQIENIKSNFKDNKKIGKIKVYFNEKQKIINLINEINDIYNIYPRPILITTNNIKSAELIYNIIKEYYIKKDIKINLISAKNIEEEYKIIKDIGKKNQITISTQIAGRGIDIPIDDEVEKAGGLHVMLYEVNNGFRIDEQLIGRTGRQGKNGSVQFYYSLEDPLLILHLNQKLKNIFLQLDLNEKDIIQSKIIDKEIKKARMIQEDTEYGLFEYVADYDLVLDDPRKVIYNIIEENKNIKDYKAFLLKILLNILESDKHKDIETLKKLGFIFEDVNIDNFYEKEKNIHNKIISVIESNLSNNEIKHIIHQTIIINLISFFKTVDMIEEGIMWRSKANKTPLVEFKKEVFDTFEFTIKNIRHSIFINLINNISAKKENELKK